MTHVPDEVRQRLRREADDRCGYCLSPQRLVFGRLAIDHIIPKARGGTRVVDESGEDYLYPADYFVLVDVPIAARRVLSTQLRA